MRVGLCRLGSQAVRLGGYQGKDAIDFSIASETKNPRDLKLNHSGASAANRSATMSRSRIAAS